MVGQVGVEPTMYPTSRVYSPLQSPLCLLTQISAVRWKQPQTPLRLSLITLFCLSILEEPDIAPILWRDRHHRRFFLFLKGVLVYALIHLWWTLWKSNPPEYPPCKGGDHPMQSQGPCCPQNLFNDHLQGRTGQVRNKMS